jgi:hypothetical protein
MGDNIEMFLKEQYNDSVDSFHLASLATRGGIL